MMTPNQTAVNGAGGATIATAGALTIFSDYATEWTLLISFLGLVVLFANFVVNKRRADRSEAREIEAQDKLMGRVPDKIEGTDNEGIS